MGPVTADERARIIAKLKEYAANRRLGGRDPELSVGQLANRVGPVNSQDVWLVLHDLARIGVVIPGQANYMQFPSNEVRNYRDSPDLFNWPFFSITPFGEEYLRNDVATLGAEDDMGYVALLRTRMPTLPDIVAEYSIEAKRAFDRGLWLGSAVLLGVAAEGILVTSYDALSRHLTPVRRPKYDKDVKGAESSAKAQLSIFKTELDVHKGEFSKDLWQRRESLLETLANVLKVNRDDVAHRRTTRIDQDSALAAVHSFPALVLLVHEINQALLSSCIVTK